MSDNNVRKRWLVIVLMGMIVLPIAATLVMASYKIVSTSMPMISGSWSTHTSRLEREQERVARIEQDGREKNFEVLCPDYFEASFLDRWIGAYRQLSWCEDYRNRMPSGS